MATGAPATSLQALAAAPVLGLGASTEFREPDDGNLGELLKSQLVELGNFVGGLKLRKEAPPAPGADADSWTPEWATRRLPSPTRDAALQSLDASLSDLLPLPALKPRDLQSASPVSSKSHATSFQSPSSGLGYELEVLRLQIAALAQSLAGLGACVMNWSAGLVNSHRQELADMVLRYTSVRASQQRAEGAVPGPAVSGALSMRAFVRLPGRQKSGREATDLGRSSRNAPTAEKTGAADG